MAKHELNLKGEVCPYTFVKSKLKLEEIEPEDELEIILDYKPALYNVPRALKEEGHEILEIKQINESDYKIKVKKAKECR